MIRFECKCGKRIKVDDKLAGKKGKCPQCQQIIQIPQPQPDDFMDEFVSELAKEPPQNTNFVNSPMSKADAVHEIMSQSETTEETKACPFCGEKVLKVAKKCKHCKEDLDLDSKISSKANTSLGDNATVRALLPVGRSGWAIAAGYLGLLSLVIFPAPLALLTSIVAILDIRKHKNKHGMGRAVFGLIMGLLGTPLCILILVLMTDNPPAEGNQSAVANLSNVRPEIQNQDQSVISSDYFPAKEIREMLQNRIPLYDAEHFFLSNTTISITRGEELEYPYDITIYAATTNQTMNQENPLYVFHVNERLDMSPAYVSNGFSRPEVANYLAKELLTVLNTLKR